MDHPFARNLQDETFNDATACPAAGGTALLPVWDLDASTGIKPANVDLSFSVPALVPHTSGTLTVSLMHGATSTPATDLGLKVDIASSTAGSVATEARFRLPSNTLRYVRGKIVSSSETDGDCTGSSVTGKLLF